MGDWAMNGTTDERDERATCEAEDNDWAWRRRIRANPPRTGSTASWWASSAC